MKTTYIRPDIGVPEDDPGLIREVDRAGTVRYLDGDGFLHREDGPAVEWEDGSRFWCRHGQLHREDGPAIEWSDGTSEWYLSGKLHREDGPAAEYADGTRFWSRNGELHREDGPAIEYPNDSLEWCLHGKLHRGGRVRVPQTCPQDRRRTKWDDYV